MSCLKNNKTIKKANEVNYLKEYTLDLKRDEWSFKNIKALSVEGVGLSLLRMMIEKKYCSIVSIAIKIIGLYEDVINYDFGYANLMKDAYIFYVKDSINENVVKSINDRFTMLLIEKIAEISKDKVSDELKREWIAALLSEKMLLKQVEIKEEDISEITFNKALISELSNIFVKHTKEYSWDNIIAAKLNYGTEGYANELSAIEDKRLNDLKKQAAKEFEKDDTKKNKEFINKSELEIYNILVRKYREKEQENLKKAKEVVSIKYRLCNGADGLECLSDPIITYEDGIPVSANSYVIKFRVLPVKINNTDIIKVVVDFVWRRWVFEKEELILSNEIETDNNVYVCAADSNFVKIITYTRDVENTKRFIYDRDKYVLEEYKKGTTIDDVLACSYNYVMDDTSGYIAIPVNQQIVDKLNEKSLSEMGLGSLDKEFSYKLIVEALSTYFNDKSIEIAKPLKKINTKLTAVKKYYEKEEFKTSKMTIGNLNNISNVLIYYVEKEEHIKEFKKAFNQFEDDKLIGNTFKIKEENRYNCVYDYNLGGEPCELKVIFKVSSLFNEPVKKIQGVSTPAHDMAYKKYITLIKETLLENKLKPTDNIMNLVDMVNYSKHGGNKGYDPYPTVKRAFLHYNQNVQIMSVLSEFSNRWDSFNVCKGDADMMKKHQKAITSYEKAFVPILRNTLLDIFQKKGVVCSFDKEDAVYDTLNKYGNYIGVVGLDALRIGGYTIITALRYTKVGLEYLTLNVVSGVNPKVTIMKEWQPVWKINETLNNFYKLKNLAPEKKKAFTYAITCENNNLFKLILNENLLPVMTSKLKKTFETRLGKEFNIDNRLFVVEENTVNIHYGIVNKKANKGLMFTHELGLFKSEYNYYLSVGKRGTTLKGSLVESIRYERIRDITKKRRAYIFVIENCLEENQRDFYAALMSEMRNINLPFESSTKTPHVIYYLGNINLEIEKAKMN